MISDWIPWVAAHLHADRGPQASRYVDPPGRSPLPGGFATAAYIAPVDMPPTRPSIGPPAQARERFAVAGEIRGADPGSCTHPRDQRGPDVPRLHGTWRSWICAACGAWRLTTHTPMRDNALGADPPGTRYTRPMAPYLVEDPDR